jgi:hypothetical protein
MKESTLLKVKKNESAEKAYAFGIVQYAYPKTPFPVTVEITNKEHLSEIISGKLRGLSTGYIVRRYECSICHNNLEDCPHEVGVKYGNEKCQMVATNVELTDISFVYLPKDPRCRVTDLLIVKGSKMHVIEYTWHGFTTNDEQFRFQNINEAKNRGLIPQRVALRIAEHFSIQMDGIFTIKALTKNTMAISQVKDNYRKLLK